MLDKMLRHWLMLILLAGLATGGCSRPSDPLLRVASNVWPGYETLYLARGLGYYEEKNIRLVEMNSNSQVSQALRNEMIEAACLTLDETLSLMQEGIDLRVVLVMDISQGADVVLARPGIASLHALRGKRVGVENGAVGALMLDAALQAGLLETKDITLVPLTVDEHAASYLAGKIDAVVTFEPVRGQLLRAGAQILFDSSRVPGRIVDLLVVRGEIAASHKKAISALISGHFRAMDYLNQQPQEAEKMMLPRLHEDALTQFTGLRLPDIQENWALLGGNLPRLQIVARELVTLMVKRKLLTKTVAVEHLLDPSFLPPEKR